VKAVDSIAAVAVVTAKPAATCGITGSTERMNSDVVNMTNARRLMKLPMKIQTPARDQPSDRNLASRSNSTSPRNSGSISFRGNMFGPSDGALSGS